METPSTHPADEADHAEEPARPTMGRATSARPPTGPAPTRRPRLVTVDEAIAFAFRQVFLAGYFTDVSVPERATWLCTLVVSWAIHQAVFAALWTASAAWGHSCPPRMRRLVPQTWIKRFPVQVGAFALCPASELLDFKTGVALRAASQTAYFAAWVADCADLPIRALSRW